MKYQGHGVIHGNCNSKPYMSAAGVHWFGLALGIRSLIWVKAVQWSSKCWLWL